MEQEKKLTAMIVGALGIVYGDIGTSPLYALKSCFNLTELPVTEANVLGIISLFIWLLIFIVNFKYITMVMKCEQQGEGGTLVLSSICSKIGLTSLKKELFILGVVAMALFAGDSIITPAISVLSAVEGFNLVINVPENVTILISIVILTILFTFQNKGSEVIGKYFGYIMVLWFLVLGLLGILSIIKNPIILYSLNPYYAFKFLSSNGVIAWASLGGAILVITGVEALYADMGHFGKEAIQLSWKYFVFPSLILNYLGQGSLLLSDAQSISNPFFLLAPEGFIYPLIFLSIIATIIASQAMISGIFSLSWQAIMLNYLPRMKVTHTSAHQRGQIYVHTVNCLLYVLTVMAVLIFKNSDSLVSAYGLSVSSVMLISTIFVSLISLHKWKWPLYKICLIFIPLLILDLIFVISNLAKIFDGAWYTLLVASSVVYVILAWTKGNKALELIKTHNSQGIKKYLSELSPSYTTRIPGCAVFMTRSPSQTPYSLKIQLKHNKFLHEKILFITVQTEDVAKIDSNERYSFEEVMPNVFIVNAKFGFYEEPSLTRIISWTINQKILKDKENISFFLSRGVPVGKKNGILNSFSEKLYIFLTRNSLPAYEFFKINHSKVIELGVRYNI